MRCKIPSSITLLVALMMGAASTYGAEKPSEKPDTPHLAFVTEYIRQLSAIENIRASSEQELKQAIKDQFFSICIHSSTMFQLELRSQVAMLKDMRLSDSFDHLIPDLSEFYENKIALHQRMIDICSAFVGGPKEGVDYAKLAAEMPQIRAKLEYIDHSLFEITPMIFATLIDQKPDSKNHLSHLVITRAERTKLIHDLTIAFGTKLDKKDQNSTVSSASVLKTYFLKDYKCADDPWE